VHMLQVWGSVQHSGVHALATLDENLEKTPLLEELDPNEMPDEVTDREGNITQDCSEVCPNQLLILHRVAKGLQNPAEYLMPGIHTV